MNTHLTTLKVKIRALAEEARIIHRYERQSITRARYMTLRSRLVQLDLSEKQVERIRRRLLKTVHIRHDTTYMEPATVIALEERHRTPKAYDAAWIQDAREQFSLLRNHRIGIVRREARASLLAYAFLRGVARSDLEKHPTPPPVLVVAMKIAERFSGEDPRNVRQKFEAWVQTSGTQPAAERAA